MAQRHILLLGAASVGMLTAQPALAQDVPAAEEGATETPGEQIIVTGTRSTSRTVENSPVPVDVLSGEQITEGGQVETNKILNKLVPSFNFPQPAISDGSDALRPATLRGLAPDQTLVLVNSKRRHTSALLNINGTVGRGSAAVDMNSIPALAIERIEVLRDGASSQYGSDAIAGVINIRLKTANDAGKAVASYGKYVTTLTDVLRVTSLQTVAGQPVLDPADNRYFLANTDGELSVRDGETYTFATNFGLPFFGEDGFLNLTMEYRHRDRTNRTGFDLRPNYVRQGTTFDPRELTFDRREFRFGDPQADDYSIFLNAGTPLGDVFEWYGFASFNQRDSISAANYRGQNNANNVDYSQLAPGQAPPNTFTRPVLTPDGFLPLINSDLTDYSYTSGIRGEVAGWRMDFSAGVGSNRFEYRVDSLNASFPGALQRSFDAGALKYRQGLFNLDFSREFGLGLAKPLTVSLGGEYRRERYQIRPGTFESYALGPLFRSQINNTTAANCTLQQGSFNMATNVCSFPGRQAGAGAQGFAGLPASAATDAGRHNYAAYLEFDTDIVDALSITAAGRYEHYSDFGDTISGKLAARFEVFPGYAVRGSISNGFRAPSLHQQVFTTTSTNFVGGVPVDILTIPASNPVAQALGSQDLRPEKSFNYSAGLTANPFQGLTLTVDYYNIKITDRIVLTENLGASGSGTNAQNAAVGAILTAAGYPTLGAARFFINGLDTRTQGVDAVMSYRLPVDFGRINLTAAYNYNKQKILQYNNDLGPLATIPGLVLFGRTESLRFTRGQPRDKIVLSADGDIGAFGFTLRSTRYGRVLSPGTAAPLAPNQTSLTALGPDDVELSPKWITDVELRYDVRENLHLAVGADNVFDVYPDRFPFGARPTAIGGVYPQNQQYNAYSIFSPFGFNGRFLYGRIGFDF